MSTKQKYRLTDADVANIAEALRRMAEGQEEAAKRIEGDPVAAGLRIHAADARALSRKIEHADLIVDGRD